MNYNYTRYLKTQFIEESHIKFSSLSRDFGAYKAQKRTYIIPVVKMLLSFFPLFSITCSSKDKETTFIDILYRWCYICDAYILLDSMSITDTAPRETLSINIFSNISGQSAITKKKSSCTVLAYCKRAPY